jgi:hypothetical protein
LAGFRKPFLRWLVLGCLNQLRFNQKDSPYQRPAILPNIQPIHKTFVNILIKWAKNKGILIRIRYLKRKRLLKLVIYSKTRIFLALNKIKLLKQDNYARVCKNHSHESEL